MKNRSLENTCLRLAVDEQGRLLELFNLHTGHLCLRPHALWRLILEHEGCLETEARPCGAPKIGIHDGTLVIQHHRVKTEQGAELEVDVRCEVRLEDDESHWSVRIRNNAADVVVRECHYPILAVPREDPPPAVITTQLIGERLGDVYRSIGEHFSGYMTPDQKYIRRQNVYPGRSCAMNCMALDWGEAGLYYGSHDPSFQITMQVLELEGGEFNLFMSKYPFLKTGGEWSENGYVLSSYAGGWHVGALKYRHWADTWFKVPDTPASIRTSPGWQRIILRHQYGEVLCRYDELEQAYADAAAAGIDTLFLFGWTAAGMDAGYPVYAPDEDQGGAEGLKQNIRKVQQQGGKVILYFNGQLIDVESDFYRNGGGKHVAIKRADGAEHREFYNFSNTGTWLRSFGNKAFVVACPSCREWRDILKRHIDTAAEIGADSVFFDQIGLCSYPCCDPDHGHPVPFTGLMLSKQELLKELHEYIADRYPGMGLGIECVTDQLAPYTDFFHIFGNIARARNDWKATGAMPEIESFQHWFKLAFPESILSNREIRDDSNVEIAVNQMILLGSRSDVEVYRCRATIAATPHYQAYLAKANALRRHYQDVLYHGKFSGCMYHRVDHPEVFSNSFLLEDRLAVICTQSHRPEITAQVEVPGYALDDYNSIRGDVGVEDGRVTLPRYGLVIMLYRRGE